MLYLFHYAFDEASSEKENIYNNLIIRPDLVILFNSLLLYSLFFQLIVILSYCYLTSHIFFVLILAFSRAKALYVF